jgi:nitrite reductase/ring-hydroxylating ferredoxin subunit
MQSQIWQPVLPSHYLRASKNIVAGFLQGQELALWRSEAGAVQAWENRCPHRGTRLTIGRILNDQLSCAYHGWEFDTRGGCTAIPANPSLPLPKQLRVKSFPVAEADGMVWVSAAAGNAAASQALPPTSTGALAFFCRSLGIRAPMGDVATELNAQGFKATGAQTWEGTLAGQAATVLLNEATSLRTFAHVWLSEEPAAAALSDVLAKCRLFRRDVEARASSRSS